MSLRAINWNDDMSKMTVILQEELAGFNGRIFLSKLLMWPIPIYVGGRMRAQLLRLAGFQIGSGTQIWGSPTIFGTGQLYKKLKIGTACLISIDCYFDLADEIVIGDHVSVTRQTMLITGKHQVGPAKRRLGPLVTQPIHIGTGVWLGARCTVLPGVTIGEGAVVGAGAMVTKDVPPNTLVAGVPAKVIRQLPEN